MDPAPGSPAAAAARVREVRADAAAAIAELDGRIADIVTARAGANSDDVGPRPPVPTRRAAAWRPCERGHDPEGATLAFERSQADALRVAARRRIAAADAALARIDAGTYGRCSVCGEPIAAGRLEARPLTDRCIRHV